MRMIICAIYSVWKWLYDISPYGCKNCAVCWWLIANLKITSPFQEPTVGNSIPRWFATWEKDEYVDSPPSHRAGMSIRHRISSMEIASIAWLFRQTQTWPLAQTQSSRIDRVQARFHLRLYRGGSVIVCQMNIPRRKLQESRETFAQPKRRGYLCTSSEPNITWDSGGAICRCIRCTLERMCKWTPKDLDATINIMDRSSKTLAYWWTKQQCKVFPYNFIIWTCSYPNPPNNLLSVLDVRYIRVCQCHLTTAPIQPQAEIYITWKSFANLFWMDEIRQLKSSVQA